LPGKSDELAWEINRGVLSGYLLKPVNFVTYAFSRDLSEKSINLLSALIEVCVLSKVLGIAIAWPHRWDTWVWLILAMAGAVVMNFLLSFIVGCWGFWTAESGGPRFCLELLLEFSAGAFFPLSVLSQPLQAFLQKLPSPYLVFFPLNIFLEKLDPAKITAGIMIQFIWILLLAGGTRMIWMRGLNAYAAQGS